MPNKFDETHGKLAFNEFDETHDMFAYLYSGRTNAKNGRRHFCGKWLLGDVRSYACIAGMITILPVGPPISTNDKLKTLQVRNPADTQ